MRTPGTGPDGGTDWRPAWTATDLKRPTTLLTAVAALAVSAAVSFNLSCQVHEIGHALVGSALGWTVDRIHFCQPGGGQVVYASTPGGAWVDVAESYAGGILAAIFLVGLYVVVFYRPRLPLRGAGWWAAGFGPVLWIGSQFMVAAVEGSNRDRPYGEVLDANLSLTVSILVVTMLLGAAIHVWLWRPVWRRTRGRPDAALTDGM